MKNAEKLPIGFSAFFLWSPLGNYEKKSCLNELKFWEASRNHKSSLSWKFHNSILKNAKTSQLSASISKKVVPFCVIKWTIFCMGCGFRPTNELRSEIVSHLQRWFHLSIVGCFTQILSHSIYGEVDRMHFFPVIFCMGCGFRPANGLRSEHTTSVFESLLSRFYKLWLIFKSQSSWREKNILTQSELFYFNEWVCNTFRRVPSCH